MAASSQGSQAQMAFDLVGIDTSSVPIDFVSESLRMSQELIQSEGIRGTRSRTKERNRAGLQTMSGNITVQPSPTELDQWLPVILGATEATDVFALAETLPTFIIAIDRVAEVHTYAGCVVNTATFSGTPGQPLNLSMEIIGATAETTGAAGSFPALTYDTDTMFVATDAVFTYNSVAEDILDFEIVIDNRVEARYVGGQVTPGDVAPTDRIVTCTVTTPFTSDEIALYAVGPGGNTGDITLTNGGQSLKFDFANLAESPAETPVVNGRGEITMGLQYQAFKSSTTNELIVTHDSTA